MEHQLHYGGKFDFAKVAKYFDDKLTEKHIASSQSIKEFAALVEGFKGLQTIDNQNLPEQAKQLVAMAAAQFHASASTPTDRREEAQVAVEVALSAHIALAARELAKQRTGDFVDTERLMLGRMEGLFLHDNAISGGFERLVKTPTAKELERRGKTFQEIYKDAYLLRPLQELA